MTAEGQLAASLTVQAAAGIFPVHSLPQVARKNHGRRKHLDLLIEDIHRRNVEVDPFDSLRTIQAHKERSDLAQKRDNDVSRADFWEPPYVTGGAPGKVMARSINNRRAADGSFFETLNPSLFQEHLPSTQPPKGPYMRTVAAMHRPNTAPQGAHMGGSTAAERESLAATEEGKAAATRPGTALSGSQALKGGATGNLNATWLTPVQTGDRKEGIRIAKMVTHRRQISGAFFEDRTAPLKIG